MKPRTSYNPKRRLASRGSWSPQKRQETAKAAGYGGNPEHKSKPNDYGLTPPFFRSPRPGKTLCDASGEFPKAKAEALLRDGLTKGMVSIREINGWPQNVWAVCDGEPFESELENSVLGTYHGYPMPANDDFRDVVLKEWKDRDR
jgi:hypothetical protein